MVFHAVSGWRGRWRGGGIPSSPAHRRGSARRRWHIKQLAFLGTPIGDEGVTALCDVLRTNKLRSLELVNVAARAAGAQVLSNGLKVNASLKVLVMDHNPLGDDGVCCRRCSLALPACPRRCRCCSCCSAAAWGHVCPGRAPGNIDRYRLVETAPNKLGWRGCVVSLALGARHRGGGTGLQPALEHGAELPLDAVLRDRRRGCTSDWRAAAGLGAGASTRARPPARPPARLPALTHPAGPIMIRIEAEMNRNVGESQSLLWFSRAGERRRAQPARQPAGGGGAGCAVRGGVRCAGGGLLRQCGPERRPSLEAAGGGGQVDCRAAEQVHDAQPAGHARRRRRRLGGDGGDAPEERELDEHRPAAQPDRGPWSPVPGAGRERERERGSESERERGRESESESERERI
jgi:hypothetical protein